jgi:hypothetical protein
VKAEVDHALDAHASAQYLPTDAARQALALTPQKYPL